MGFEVKGTTKMSDAEFLSFRDWIESKDYLRSDWVLVCCLEGLDKPEIKSTFSALISDDMKSRNLVMSSFDWNVSFELGHPRFQKNEKGEVSFDMGQTDSTLGITFEAFAIYRNFHDAYESSFELSQNFILYHNLHYDRDQEKHIDPLSDEEVIMYPEHCTIRVKATYLRDYLAARKMVLVRFHDHRRFVGQPAKKALGKESFESETKTDESYYHVRGADLNGTGKTFSRLLGKDLITPFAEPANQDYLFLAGKTKEEFAKFVIGITGRGNMVESTCDEKKLSNYFVDRGTPHFLTPVFFKRDVLQKYYATPRRYTVRTGILQCLDLWNIPFGVNNEGLVHVWLGDLGRIPYEEQMHWRLHNVLPSGGLEEAFYRTQILAEFAESKDPIHLLQNARDHLNSQFESKFSFRLFRELGGEDSYLAKSIHVPTSAEQKELDEQLLYLAKYLVDSIDKSLLEERVKWRPTNQGENTSIRFLKAFLEEVLGMQETLARQSTDALRMLQSMRSLSSAHLKPTEYRKELEKLGLAALKPKGVIEKLSGLVTGSLTTISDAVETYKEPTDSKTNT
jgi:hypothetical protein